MITRENAPPLFKGGNDYAAACQSGENWMPLQDDEIYYDGQIIGLVVADTLERAVGAAELVKTSYQSCRPMVDLSSALKKPDTTQPPTALGQKLQYQRGDVEEALAKSAVRIEQTYTTPIQHHNPLEPHASVAEWSDDGRSLTLHETSQWVVNSRNSIARMLGIDQSAIKVRVLSPFLGGGFGCKGYAWAFSALAAASARELGRPVKLVLSRRQMYSLNGHRPATTQTVTLGADRRGRLKATRHLSGTYTSKVFQYIEPVVLSTQLLYKCASLQTGSGPCPHEHRHADADARSGRDARPVRAGIGDGRAGGRHRHRSDRASVAELCRARPAHQQPPTLVVEIPARMLRQGCRGIRLGEPAEGPGEPARGALADRLRHGERHISGAVHIFRRSGPPDRRWPGRDRGRQP